MTSRPFVPLPRAAWLAAFLCALLPAVVVRGQPDGPDFVHSIGNVGPIGQLNRPMGVAVSPGELSRVFVVDSGNARVQAFTPTGLAIGYWGGRGNEPGQFWSPTDVAVSMDGRYVYVVDQASGYVQRFEPEASCFEPGQRRCFSGNRVARWGGLGEGDSLFHRPTGIAVDRDGRVYVTDYAGNDIQVFSADGEFLARIGEVEGPGALHEPADIDIGPDGRLWVADRENGRIAMFDRDGVFVGGWDAGGKLFHPVGIAVDALGGFVVRDLEPSYGLPRAWRYGPLKQLDWACTLGGVDLAGLDGDSAYPVHGVALLPGGLTLLTDPLGPNVNLLLAAPGANCSLTSLVAVGQELDQLSYPMAVALDEHFTVVADSGNGRVLVIDRERETLVTPLGGFLNQQFDLDLPRGVAVHRTGPARNDAILYIADPNRHSIFVGSPGGQPLARWGDGVRRSAPEGLNLPHAVAVGPDGDVFIADTGNNRIVRRRGYPDGRVVNTIGRSGMGPGELQYPMAVAVGPDGLVYVLDEGLNRLQAFHPDGALAREWPDAGARSTDPGDLWVPVGLAADDRYIYVLENGPPRHVRVQVFRPGTEVSLADSFVVAFAERLGPVPDQVWKPRGLAASPDGRVVIADSGNNRLQVYRWSDRAAVPSTPTPPPPSPTDVPPSPTASPVAASPTAGTGPATDVPTAEPTRRATQAPPATPGDEPDPNKQPTPRSGQVIHMPMALRATR